MSTFWNERFAQKDYVYGVQPNPFFKKRLDKLPVGNLLLPGEGEGRNAVYAAMRGWDVYAFDSSTEGRKKAMKLAKLNKVSIDYHIKTYDNFTLSAERSFDCIALIYTHMPPLMRTTFHSKLLGLLKDGGQLILEGFSKDQLGKSSGGPKDESLLFSEEDLRKDFSDLSMLHVEQLEIQKKEGIYHQGLACLIRLSGIK
jgi:hypothetical protein